MILLDSDHLSVLKDLKTAAGHSNPKAMSVLGTMYATGHCVDRDLPSAYRWFARALHLDPGNARVQRDLEVLWRQMSADERQLAMRSSRRTTGRKPPLRAGSSSSTLSPTSLTCCLT